MLWWCWNITKKARRWTLVSKCHHGQCMFTFLLTSQACSHDPHLLTWNNQRTILSSIWHKSCRSQSHPDSSLGKCHLLFHWIILCSLQNKPCDLSLFLLKQTKIATLFYPTAQGYAGCKPTLWLHKSRQRNELGWALWIVPSSKGTAVQIPHGSRNSEEACTQQSQLSHKYLLLIQGTVLCNSAAQGKVFHIRSLGGYARHWHIICQTGRTGKKRVIFTSVCLQYTWTAPTRGSLPFQNSPGAVSLWPKFHPGTVTGPRLASSVEKTLIKGVFWNQRSQESLYKASQSLA